MQRVLLANRYELQAPLERHPDGTVWRARDHGLDRDVAARHVTLDGATNGSREQLLERVRRAVEVRDQHVTAVHDVIEEDDRVFVVTGRRDAPTVSDLVALHGALDEDTVRRIGAAVAQALLAIHERGLTHGHLGPGSVTVPADGPVQVSDLDMACLRQFNGHASAVKQRRAKDLRALGVTLLAALTGTPEPETEDLGAAARAVASRGALGQTIADLLTAPDALDAATVRDGLEGGTDPVTPGDDATPAPAAGRQRSAAQAAPSGTTVDESEVDVPPHLRFDATREFDPDDEEPVAPPSEETAPDIPIDDGDDDRSWGPAGTGSATGSQWRLAMAAGAIAIAVLIAAIIAIVPGPGGDAGDTARESPAGVTENTGGAAGAGTQSGDEGQAGGEASGQDADGGAATKNDGAEASDAPTASTNVPDGWVVSEGDGYRFAHPPEWQTSRVSAITTQYRDPETGTYVRISREATAGDPLSEWASYEDDFAARKQAYDRVRIEPFEVHGTQGAIWEYTYRDAGATLHAINIKIPGPGGGYAFNLQSHADRWDEVSERLGTFLAAFQPTA